MREVIERALPGGDVQPPVTVAAQGQQQVRFGALGMAIQANAAPTGQGLVNGLLTRLRRIDTGQQGVGIVIQHRGVQARLVNPPD